MVDSCHQKQGKLSVGMMPATPQHRECVLATAEGGGDVWLERRLARVTGEVWSASPVKVDVGDL